MIDYFRYKNSCISFLQKLVQIPSVNGQNNEEGVVKLIAEEAIKLGLPLEIHQNRIGRPNIYIGSKKEFGGEESLLLIAHTDTVTEGNVSNWAHPPFSGKIADNQLYGRGAIDCKGGIALSVYALKILKDLNLLHLAKFIGVVDEESGANSEWGLKYVLEKGLRAKGAVYTYGGGSKLYHTLHIGHRGVTRIKVTFKGKSAHSGYLGKGNERADNAIDHITSFIARMRSANLPGENPYFEYRFVATPTLLCGGVAESIVPEEAYVLYDIRTLPSHTLEELLELLNNYAKEIAQPSGYTLEVKTHVPSVLSDPNSPFIIQAAETHQRVFGNTPKMKGSGPANESHMLISKGIPTIAGYGLRGEGFHAANEYAELESLEKPLEFLVQLALGSAASSRQHEKFPSSH